MPASITGERWRLLYLPNDPNYHQIEHRQNGPREAFEQLQAEGVLATYDEFPYLAEFREHRDPEAVKATILRFAAEKQPDLIFWQHVAEFPVDQKFFDELRRASSNALLVYHEGDPFGRVFKRISPTLSMMLRNADLVFAIALAPLSDMMRRHGAKDLRFVPHSYDKTRFFKPWSVQDRRPDKVAMIANRGITRMPGLSVPGARSRIRLAHRLTKTFGKDFALYGNGWSTLSSARGPLRFDQQIDAIRASWVSVNWDHFDHFAFYFSDRLPISLMAGVPHVTSYHLGYEDILRGCPGLYWAKTVEEAAAKVDWLLSRPSKDLIDEGHAAHEWVQGRLDAETVYRDVFNSCTAKLKEHRKLNDRVS